MKEYFTVFFPWLFIGAKLLLAVLVFMPLWDKKIFFTRKLGILCVGLCGYTAFTAFLSFLYADVTFWSYLLYFLHSAYLFVLIIICCKGTITAHLFHLFSAVMLSSGLEAFRNCILDLDHFDLGVVIHPDTWPDVLITLLLMLFVYGVVSLGFVRHSARLTNITPDKSIVVLYVIFSLTMPIISIISKYILESEPLIAIALQLIVVFYTLSMLYLQYAVYIGKVHQLLQQNEQTEKEAIQRLSRETFEMYNLLKENMDSINVKCHDLKYCLAAKNLAGDAWSKELIESIDIYDRTIKTGNEELDTVLTYHQMRCHGNHITFLCVADGSHLSFMELADLYTLFGNAISNASEYLMSLPEDKRIIRLYIKIHQSFMLIHVENYFEGELQLNDGIPVTIKGDTVNHGFGLKSMKLVAEKYGGTLDIRVENHLFQLNICFPLQGII